MAAAGATAAALALALALAVLVYVTGRPARDAPRPPGAPGPLPTTPGSYLGVYQPGVPGSYAPVTSFTALTGVRPRLVVYYSGWFEPFKAGFAAAVAAHGGVPLVQVDPSGIRLAAIASGQYDSYLRGYAAAVRAYRRPVVLSFGHEMNAGWYSWGYRQASPAMFVAAWRHIVTLFRAAGARNATWQWTVNVIDETQRGRIPRPGPWWPGRSYVNWVGIDGYYYRRSWTFASLFGPTITAVRELTGAPVLISETSALPAADQPGKLAQLFAGIRLYGLLGMVWFDSGHHGAWRLSSPAAITAFRRGATTLRPAQP